MPHTLFGASQSGIRIFEALTMAGSVWGMVRLTELHLGRRSVGFIAGALASIIHAQLDFWHTAQPETFGGTLTIWGSSVSRTMPHTLFGASQSGIRIFEALTMAGSVWGMVRLTELHLGRRSVGFIAGALASIIHAQLDFWHTAQPETFGGTLTIW